MEFELNNWSGLSLAVASQGQSSVPEVGDKYQSDARPRLEVYGLSIRGPAAYYQFRSHFSISLARAEWRALIEGKDVSHYLSSAQSLKVGLYFEPSYANYGPRAAHQIPMVVRALQHNPRSRQAVLYMNVRPRTRSRRLQRQPACIQSIQFIWSPEGEVHAIASFRSSDLYRGFPYDWYMISRLVHHISHQLPLSRPGEVICQIGNGHIYLEDLPALIEDLPSYHLVHHNLSMEAP